MQLSIVILNYNVRHYLELCLQSVVRAAKGLDAEIIVVDNASQDDSVAMVTERFPQVRLLINTDNVGFSKANNQGVALAKGDYICILNPDTVVPEDCFKELIAFLSSDRQRVKGLKTSENIKKLGAVGIRLIDGAGHFLLESKRNVPTPGIALKKILGLSGGYYASQQEENGQGQVDVLVGAFLFLKRAVYMELGGFDESYFMYGEDIDFSYRLTQAGYVNWYLGRLTAIHFKGESTTHDAHYIDRFYGAMRLFYNRHFKMIGFQGILVGWGLAFAKKLKVRQINFRESEVAMYKKPTNHVLLSSDPDFIKKIRSNFGKKDVKVFARQKEVSKQEGATQFIFDTTHQSFKKIIRRMHLINSDNNRNDNTFRIRPEGRDFILGSDRSTSKGEVVKIS